MTAALLALLLAASAPGPEAALRVRVLARYQPTSIRVKASALRCDGQAAKVTEGRISVAQGRLLVEGGSVCQAIDLQDAEISLGTPKVERAYRGVVHARARDGLVELIDEVGLEEYLASVVGSETVTAEPAALEAQAVVSRTFATASRGRHGSDGFDLCDLSHCQVYAGASGEREASRKAVAGTRGQLLERDGRIEPVWFHSSCGGATSAARDVFGDEQARGVGVEDRDEKGAPLCAGSPDAGWSFSLARGDLAKALGLPAQGKALEVARKDRAGRIVEVRAFGARMSGAELLSKVGREVGWHKLKSLVAEVEESGGEVRFRGRGLGHGVGMCQWGASALAKQGKGYREILGHYFPGAVIGQ